MKSVNSRIGLFLQKGLGFLRPSRLGQQPTRCGTMLVYKGTLKIRDELLSSAPTVASAVDATGRDSYIADKSPP